MNEKKAPRTDMRLAAYMPDPSAIFVKPPHTLDDVRDLQKNPAYLAAVQALRIETMRSALEGRPDTPGLQSALNILGMVEYEAQLEPEAEPETDDDGEPREVNADEIGFEEIRRRRG